ncbi:MAG: excinuclease ABC subunit UvrC [Clostridia bacterium]|nr:excinuclease ABC subunit UvrC [Clostridia bacterium]
MNDLLREKLKLLPESPGVYMMYDARGEVIYVGKAVNLKNRVRQYFQASKTHSPKVRAMVSHIEDFELILTANETEALTLECNLIKQYRPRYNILLKDDKHFPYVRVDLKQDFPRLEVVRKVKKDGARYLGPYLSGIALRDSLNAVRDYFPIRHCKKDLKKAIAKRERPCLMHHVGKCCAPCSGNISREEYHAQLQQVIAFLEGHTQDVIKTMTEQMMEASDNMEFERAAQLRDRIRAITALGERQQAIAASTEERDIFALASDGMDTIVFALFMRGGKVIGTERFTMLGADDPAEEIMASFLQQYYSDAGHIPKEILVKDLPSNHEKLCEWLSETAGRQVQLHQPQRGDKRKQVELAYQNGMELLSRENALKRKAWERTEGAAMMLGQLIGLAAFPERIECYDNSHIQGTDTVGCMVVFLNGSPEPKEYRRFRIKTKTAGDDYAAMREMLTRRFARALQGDKKFTALPDLLVVDGGRGQLNIALEVLEEMGLSHIPAIGLAERNEEIILPEQQESLLLERSNPVLHLLQRIRDEAHRFAITFHRSVHARNALFSVLDEIPGIGPKRKRALFDAFTTLDAIKSADIEALSKVPGMNRLSAQTVYDWFHEEKEEQ